MQQAAQQVGVTRQTIFRHLKQGKVSGTRNHAGFWQFDTAELLRAYGELQAGDVTGARQRAHAPLVSGDASALHVQVIQLQAQVELKDALLAVAQERNAELKAAADKSDAVAARLMAILETKLLEAPKPAPVIVAAPKAKKKKA